MKGGNRAGSGAKKGMRNAAKPPDARRDIDKSVSYSATEWNIIEAALIATGQTHSAFARVATVAAAKHIKENVMKFKFAFTVIARPYVEIEAENLDAAKQIIYDEEFSLAQREELLDTSWPFSDIQIDEIYDENDCRIREKEEKEEEEA